MRICPLVLSRSDYKLGEFMLEKVKLMAIIREVDPDCTKKAIEILAEEGFRDFEISLSDSELGRHRRIMRGQRYT